ncbi:MAG: hypothetical protein M1821_009292 [Bathelium mastoideum]|nr:MAG: hypothetical protein M1821_009292 [Bathelium mastoideum]KAI9686913.1 MAG: hypothetical protein M1822_002666 [Bathelium mastoideum]
MAQESTALGGNENGPIFFWREFEEPYGFLSQWYECTFEHDGIKYHHAEMWMMTQKAKLFNDQGTSEQMMQTIVPKEHQALGRKVKGYNGKVWDQNKSRIVEEGNWWKFTNCLDQPQLKRLLLETGDRELVEASPTDRIWGVGFDAYTAEANRKDWGQNLLGKAIMAVRKRIKEQESE